MEEKVCSSIDELVSVLSGLVSSVYKFEKHPCIPGVQFYKPVPIYFDFSEFESLSIRPMSVTIHLKNCQINLVRSVPEISFFMFKSFH